MLATSQLPIQTTKFFYIFLLGLVPLQFEKGSATHALDSKYAPFPIPVIS